MEKWPQDCQIIGDPDLHSGALGQSSDWKPGQGLNQLHIVQISFLDAGALLPPFAVFL